MFVMFSVQLEPSHERLRWTGRIDYFLLWELASALPLHSLPSDSE